jgi:DNA-binding NarL/FixJ family response regulator
MPANSSNSQRAKRGNSSISVLVASDHGVMRDCLASMLRAEHDIKVVGAVADAGAALREAERLSPRIVVLGVANAVETTRQLAEKTPGAAILIVSATASPLAVRHSLEAGALGYLDGESSADDVVKAIRSVATGRRYLGQGLAEKIVDDRHAPARAPEQVEALTATERNILRLVSEGKSNAEVAEMIGLSARTVETYRLRLMRKLGIGDLASLVKYAIRQGITSLE